ncbi:Interleukin-17B [Holothuria leucospilota]|uniref:Interleukin-17B n=1 Tax=Holothuria leucospilota TaxID=206669 RepID=A0A9Q1HCC1_HOLLE|nr:Interleukin-17B [Holothuria leucospilota]
MNIDDGWTPNSVTNVFIVTMVTWLTTEASPILPSIGECQFPDAITYDHYLSTKNLFYPYEPVYGVQLFNETEEQRQDITVKKNPYSDVESKDKHCPSNGEPLNNLYKHNPDAASLCPWYYDIDHDPDRIPTTISVAKCKCNSCLSPYDGKVQYDQACQEVTYRLKVLKRRGCQNGLFNYVVEDEEVAVACACMRNA